MISPCRLHQETANLQILREIALIYDTIFGGVTFTMSRKVAVFLENVHAENMYVMRVFSILYRFLPPSIFCRLFETLQSLFWSVFGLLNLYVTNVKARHEFTEFVGATMFGTYNVISLVVLLNMLIAMMNNSYQLIAVSCVGHNIPCPVTVKACVVKRMTLSTYR